METNLLRDQLFKAELGEAAPDGGDISMPAAASARGLFSLPELLVHLFAGRVVNFPRLRTHQAPYFHMFLCQLAALAVERAGMDPATIESLDAKGWTKIILGLTPEFPKGEAWDIQNDDTNKPAFLQPPVLKGARDGKEPKIHQTPDEIDLIGTSRSHAQKSGHGRVETEHWIHALICRQTAGGYGGAYNFGVMRAPGADAPRFLVALVSSLNPSHRFKRDLLGLLATKHEVLEIAPFLDETHKNPLLWTLRWDGDQQLAPGAVGPWSIEAGMRLRLQKTGSGYACLRRQNTGRRISEGTSKDQSLLGKLGDPWAPVFAKIGSSACIESAKPGLEWYAKLVFDPSAYRLPPLAKHIPGVDDGKQMWLRIEGIHSEDSRTSWVEKSISLPRRERFSFRNQEIPAALDMLVDIGRIHSQILMPAMIAWYGDNEPGPVHEEKIKAIKKTAYQNLRTTFSSEAEDAFFASATEAVSDPEGAKQRWRDAAMDAAATAYEAFLDQMPTREDSSRRRRARGLGALRALIKKFQETSQVQKDIQMDIQEEKSESPATPLDYDSAAKALSGHQEMSTDIDRQQLINVAVGKIMACISNPEIIPAAQFSQIESFDVKNVGQRVPNAFWKILGQSLPGYLQGDMDGRERFAWFAIVKVAAMTIRAGTPPIRIGQALAAASIRQLRYDHIMQPYDENDARDTLVSTAQFLVSKGINFFVTDIASLLLLKDDARNALIEQIDQDFYRELGKASAAA